MLDGLFPDDVVTEWGDPLGSTKPVFPEEEASVARAVFKRQREFAKGRECARAAMGRLGFHDVALLVGKDREPLWPAELVGSITHTAGLCAVAVARASRYSGIGIDAEPAEPLEPEVANRVCREDEANLPSGSLESALASRLVFCAKEAFYKCQFVVTRKFLGFDDVSVTLGNGTFRARLLVDAAPFRIGGEFFGRFRRLDGHLVTATWVERPFA